jgi:hydroxymethylbilane synthase
MKPLRIGTRGSKLALVQAGMVEDALKAAHPDLRTETVIIQTSGDWKPEQGETRLSESAGGKGLFAREIELALLDGAIDCGVHSLKDLASALPEGLAVRHVLPRADSRDAFLSNGARRIADLKQGAVVGTSSLRRQAMLLKMRPDLKIVTLRGNVPTRIEKLRAGQVDATILAYAGLRRLGLESEVAAVLEFDEMLPAACQGIVGIETRRDDNDTAMILDAIHHRATGLMAAAERMALGTLSGSCHTPIGAQAVIVKDTLSLRVLVASADGTQIFMDEQSGPVQSDEDAALMGQVVGMRLKARVPPNLLS